jgi:RHS repeat-associated protein
VTDSSLPPQSDQAALDISIESQQVNSGATVYSYAASYDGDGNVQQYQDTVMGTWNFSYDAFNRLQSGTALSSGTGSNDFTGQNMCWAYDSYGNRTAELTQTAACPSQESSVSPTETYNADNQIASGYVQYDLAGDIETDTTSGNSYLYDAEGRICAVQSTLVPGMPTTMGYIYDADGQRVAKGSIAVSALYTVNNGVLQPTIGCDPTSWPSFQLTESYVLGPSGEELTMLDGNGNWQRTNVYSGSDLIATYDMIANPDYTTGSGLAQQIPALHFHITDPLGTRRMQTSSVGQPETDCQSLPFGDQQYCFPDADAPATADDATPLHFTGKERDAESGNDYFGARYYGSSMGRFMSPDPSGLLAQNPADPQSWNLYAYARNNPLIYLDPNGLDCIYATDNGKGVESIDHDSNSGECGSNGGTWLSGYVDEDWAHYNKTAKAFEAASEDGGQVNFAQFQAGAQTNDSGDCSSGCGSYGFASTSADFLTGQLVGNSRPTDGSDPLDGLLTFMTKRDQAVTDFWKGVAGPLNGKDNWAGPGGMGPPTGTGDWRAAVHDYNFDSNGHISIGMYFNPTLSPATSRALIQSNMQLMKTGGFQGAKEKGFFGIVNAFQWYSNSWK